MKVFGFYVVTFVYSWSIWILGIILFPNTMPPELLVSLGGLGTIVGVITYWLFAYTRIDRIDYIKRATHLKHIPLQYWILAITVPFLILLVSKLTECLFCSIPNMMLLDESFIQKGWIYPFFLFLFGPVPEELAWRGIALDSLAKIGIIKAQLIVSMLWALWHIPLFFIQGSYQNQLGIFTLQFWLFFLNVIFPSLIVGWLYIKSNRSIVIAVLFHYMLNLSGEMIFLNQQGEIVKTIVTIVVALALLCNQALSLKQRGTNNLGI